ncbi:MAG TPA: lytic transglycosylase domain-containing protein [Methylocella sp.]|nr:lytic transglycosylase domain-containing protein [Methylocella sp.]
MLTRHSPFGRIFFGRIPGVSAGAVAFCALAAGWIVGRHEQFIFDRGEELWSMLRPPSPPTASLSDSQKPEYGQEREDEIAADNTPFAKAPADLTPQNMPLLPELVSPAIHDIPDLTQGLLFYKAGALAQGDAIAAAAQDNIVKTALQWVALRNFPREAGFERLQAFMLAHPTWPALDWLRKRSEESLYGDHKSTALIKSYFSGVEPETAAGKLALARVLMDDGKPDDAALLVRQVWRDADLNATIEAKVRSDFGAFLGRTDHKYRADRLLYKNQAAAAFRAAALAGPDVLALARARAAVVADEASDRLLAKVPAALRADPGYVFALVHKLRHADKIQAAVEALLRAPRGPAALIDGDEWWIERRLLARKLLDQNDAATAYKICAEHSASSHEMQLEAEFHAGWIALRFLNDPVRAAKHFDTLAKLAETPMSRARANYWQGRAAEASSGDNAISAAREYYEKAAAFPASYYGQLARGKLGLSGLPIRAISDEARDDERDDSIKVAELLFAAGEKDLAAPLVFEAARHLADESQVAALASLVARLHDAHLSLSVGKILGQRGIPVDTLAFPDYGVPSYTPLQNSAATSVVYSIARQESAFDPSAESSAGAKGLMQMILSTAKRTAEHAGIVFDAKRLLTDAAFNAQLAARHLGELLAEHRGSYILTFSAYNAGGKHVKEWIDAYGDPRKPGVDPVDWVERIPFTETRNYVQRVIENLNVYQVRFGEKEASLSADALLRAQAKL